MSTVRLTLGLLALALPTGPGVSREDIRRICDLVRVGARNGTEVTARWHRDHSGDGGPS